MEWSDEILPEEEVKARLAKVKAVSTNKTCFDCPTKNPNWATVTYGVLLCLNCSGYHRQLGTHLTFVRSMDLDMKWTEAQVKVMEEGGGSLG